MPDETTRDLEIKHIHEALVRIELNIGSIRSKLESDYVTQKEFAPIRKFFWGLVGFMTLGVLITIAGIAFKMVTK